MLRIGAGIDVVGIAIPNSLHIGEVFMKKGIKHVLCFNSDPDSSVTFKNPEQEDDLIQPRLNYIFLFCTEFYGLLADGSSVKNAFTRAKADMDNKVDQVWEYQESLASVDTLNTVPVLLD